MLSKDFIIKGDLCYSQTISNIQTQKDGYLVCVNGQSKGIFSTMPEEYNHLTLLDYTGQLVIPGMVDIHLHAPQYQYRGLGMDMELLEWLNTITFPEESKYSDIEYAKRAYTIFTEDLKKSVTTRACIFATLHTPSTLILMDMLEKSGLQAMVGKVNMDRNSPDYLCEETKDSVEKTIGWIKEAAKFQNITPIITPRFIPTCTDDLMKQLTELCIKYQLPAQSHLSENPSEIDWVKELCPEAEGYADAYRRAGMFGNNIKTVMAHCVHVTEAEQQMMKERGVYVAHCPQSNENLSSGIAPIRRFLKNGMKVALGTDVAGGATLSMFRAITDAIQCSKLLWRLEEQPQAPLTLAEVFFMATKGGGEFFGKVGSFEAGYEIDAIVLSEADLPTTMELNLNQRLERMIYLSESKDILHKFVAGQMLF